jgi:hypothetical protein
MPRRKLAELENRNLTTCDARSFTVLNGAVSQPWPAHRYGQDVMSRIRWRLSVRGHRRSRVTSPQRWHRTRGDAPNTRFGFCPSGPIRLSVGGGLSLPLPLVPEGAIRSPMLGQRGRNLNGADEPFGRVPRQVVRQPWIVIFIFGALCVVVV